MINWSHFNSKGLSWSLEPELEANLLVIFHIGHSAGEQLREPTLLKDKVSNYKLKMCLQLGFDDFPDMSDSPLDRE